MGAVNPWSLLMYLTDLRPGILPGAARPESIPLGRITALIGRNGTGKSRVCDALTLLTEGILYDASYRTRDPIKDRGILLRLTTPDATEITTSARIVTKNPKLDGETISWSMKIERDDDSVVAKTPKARRPNGFPDAEDHVLLLHYVESLLRKDAADARALLLPRIVGDVSGPELRSAIDPALPPTAKIPDPETASQAGLPGIVTPEPVYADGILGAFQRLGMQPPSTLTEATALRDRLGAEIATLNGNLKAQAEARTETETALPVEPTPEGFDHIARILVGIRLILLERKTRTETDRLTTALNAARTNLDQIAPDPGEPPTPPQPSPWEAVSIVQAALRSGVTFPGMGPLCLVCGAPPDLERFPKVVAHVDMLRAGAPVQSPYAAAHATWTEATRRRERALALIGATEADLARAQVAHATVMNQIQGFTHADAYLDLPATGDLLGGLWSADTPTVSAAEATYQGKLDTMTGAQNLWTAYRQALVARKSVAPRLDAATLILERIESAIRVLLARNLEAFEARMARYMPDGWEPVLHLWDPRGRPMFVLTVRETATGIEGWRPSGGQSLALLVAFTTALFEKNPPIYALYIPPEERMFDGDTLGRLLRAWKTLPDWIQVVVTGGEPPKRRIAGDIEVIQFAPDGSILGSKANPDPGGGGE